MSEAVRLWVSHPRIRRYIQIDVCICMLLTFIIALLIVMGILGIRYFVEEGREVGIAQSWLTEVISVLVSVMIFVYFIILYLLIKEQFKHWYQWWRRNVDVHLVLDPSTTNTDNSNVETRIVTCPNADNLNVETRIVTSPEYQ
jgi:hypothetical protein